MSDRPSSDDEPVGYFLDTVNHSKPSDPPHLPGNLVSIRPSPRQAGFEAYVVQDVTEGRLVQVEVLTDRRGEADVLRVLPSLIKLSLHPYIASIYGMGRTRKDELYILGEYPAKGYLADVPALRWTASLDIGVKLSSALAALHGEGFVHGGIDPRHVFFDAFGRPLLSCLNPLPTWAADWKESGDAISDSERSLHPSLPYSSDVYSLAAVIYWCLTGRPPRGNSRRSAAEYADFLGAGRQHEAEKFAEVFGRALSADPSSRPSALEFGAMLQSLQRTAGESATEMTVAEVTRTARAPLSPGVEERPLTRMAHGTTRSWGLLEWLCWFASKPVPAPAVAVSVGLLLVLMLSGLGDATEVSFLLFAIVVFAHLFVRHWVFTRAGGPFRRNPFSR